MRRNIRSRKGHPSRLHPHNKEPHKKLGGIPMGVTKAGNIVYKQRVPKNYSTKRERGGELIYFDAESEERRDSPLPIGEGSFIRRHIYETRFGIRTEETDEERRKREYKEWIEKVI